MLGIRLQRTGRKNSPCYRIIVSERSAPIKGNFLEILGHYLPHRKNKIFEYNEERIRHWMSHGACISQTLARLLNKAGVKGMDSCIKKRAMKPTKAEREAIEADKKIVKKTEDKPEDKPEEQPEEKAKED